MAKTPIVSIENLAFSYKAGPTVLSIKSLEIHPAEKVFIYGPSGSGKTTLLGLLAGVLQAKRGKINILGKNLTELSASGRDADCTDAWPVEDPL